MTVYNVFDGHLDLAMNALDYERDQTLPVEAIRARETPPGGDHLPDGRGTAMVSLPELRAGYVAAVTATVLARAKPWVRADRLIRRDDSDWPSHDMAHAAARGQLAYYELLARRGEIELITTREQLDACFRAGPSRPDRGAAATRAHEDRDSTLRVDRGGDAPARRMGVILMMEGADPITTPDEVGLWHAWGVRCLSLAHFGHSGYACGTPPKSPSHGPGGEQDGPLTPAGRELLRAMAPLGMVLDLTHLSDRSFAEAVELYDGPVCATHSNCRTIADTPRQITDMQVHQIVERGGVIGIAIHNGMLQCLPGSRDNPPREDVSLARVADHVLHICELAGNCNRVALGSDLDGGYGREKTPRELDTHRDLQQLGPLLRERGLKDADIEAFFSGNWRRFWGAALPG